MNVETREALLFLERQGNAERDKLLREREELQDKVDELDAKITTLERRLTAIGEDIRR